MCEGNPCYQELLRAQLDHTAPLIIPAISPNDSFLPKCYVASTVSMKAKRAVRIQRLRYNLLRAAMRVPFVGAAMRRVAEYARLRVRLVEEIIPHDVHHFDPQTWVIKQTKFGARVWCSLDDQAISRPILLDCYELPETQFVSNTIKAGDLTVDAGANIGYYTLLFARLVGNGGHVEAFEPIPYLAEALHASVVENGFQSRVTVHRLALDERQGTVSMRHAPRTANFGGAHFSSKDSPQADHVDEVVQAVRLDDIVGDRRCALLKIDVEGAEPRVIRGARVTLATARPVILSELHDKQLRLVSGSNASDLIDEMAALGYRCSCLNPDGTRGETLHRYGDARPVNVIFDPLESDSGLLGD